MDEERWGEQWEVGGRIRYTHPDRTRHDTVSGRIVQKGWGRVSGKPSYWFNVVADGESEAWVVGPGNIQPLLEENAEEAPVEPAGTEAGSGLVPATGETASTASDGAQISEFPEPFPERTGFGPYDADEQREWRKRKARWERTHGGPEKGREP